MLPAIAGHAYEAPPSVAAPAYSTTSMRTAVDTVGCSAKPIGRITVATLSNAPIVTLFANGHPVVLLLDTGAERTVLTPAVAERIGAQPPRVEFLRQMHGAAGTLSSREVELRSFTVSDVAIRWRRVLVAPVTMATIFSIPLDGLLGADVLSSFDIDLDLPHQQMLLYEKQSCPSAPPWAGPYTGISTGRSRGEHLFFPVQLDGRGLVAFVDTGAQRTLVSTTAALALGVTEAALARDRLITTRDATAQRLSSHVHRFSQLTVGSEVIRNPEVVVTNVKLRDADIVLGVDFLESRRIWLSYGSLRIFLSSR
ncbi:MAG: retroviral-like aspartic protease family protein [Stellaceae bacterium]